MPQDSNSPKIQGKFDNIKALEQSLRNTDKIAVEISTRQNSSPRGT